MDSRRTFIRGLLLAGFGFILFFTLEFFVEWWRLGRPGLEQVSWAGQNNAKLVDVLSPMARAYNNVLAMLIATIGLAIPLTANMHTPKLIDMFLRDRLNQVMLFAFAFGAANVLVAAYMIGPDFAPMWAIRVSVAGALVGWAALIPYFFYVVRFLDPSNIIDRLKSDVEVEVDRAARGKVDLEAAQDFVHERVHQLGTILIKSIDRADRGVVLEAIWSIKRVIDHHATRKAEMPDAWFKVDRRDFVGLSAEAIEVINEERTWLEHKALYQMQLAYVHALSKSSDAVSSLSDATRVIATGASTRGDGAVARLAVRFFNNFLREGIKRKDTHAIYDLFYQYRLLAREPSLRPDLLRDMGRYFRFYGEMARAHGLEFIAQISGFDLGWMVRRAYEARSEVASGLLDELLRLDHEPGGKLSPLLVKANLILGGFFLETGHPDEAERVRAHLANVPPETVRALGEEIQNVSERCYWEVTDRQVNFEWTEPARRQHVAEFVATLTG